MFCGKCGQQIQDGVKFCPACGSQQGAETMPAADTAIQNQARPEYQATSEYQAVSAAAPMDPKKKKTIIIAAAVAVVALVVILLVVFLGKDKGGGGASTPEEAAQAAARAYSVGDLALLNDYWLYDQYDEDKLKWLYNESGEYSSSYSYSDYLDSIADRYDVDYYGDSIDEMLALVKEECAEDLERWYGKYTITTRCIEKDRSDDSDDSTLEYIIETIEEEVYDYGENSLYSDIDTKKITEYVDYEVKVMIEGEDGEEETVKCFVRVVNYDGSWRVRSCYYD